MFWRVVNQLGVARLTWFAYGLSILALVSLALIARTTDLNGELSSIDETLSANAQGYAKYVALNISITDQELVSYRAKHLSGRTLPSASELKEELPVLEDLLLQLAIADANGQIIYSSLGASSTSVSIADRAHFLAAKNNPKDELFISEPVIGRLSRKPSLQLTRPVFSPAGVFSGVIVASIDPEQFKKYFTDLKVLNHDGAITIFGLDGLVRFRLNRRGFSAGQNLLGSPQWQKLSTLDSGLFTQNSLVDGVARRVAFQKLEGYPLVIAVGVGLDESLRGFHARWELFGLTAILMMLVLTLIAKITIRLAKGERRSIDRLVQNRERVQQKNLSKSRFLASVSHELRTPLNSILGFSELIRDTDTGHQTSHFADLIHKSGTRLHALINTILDLSKIESGQMVLTSEYFDLPQLLDTLVQINKVGADEKKIELSLSVVGVTQSVVQADRSKLVLVINNVLHNAIKFTSTGAIFVVLKPQGDKGLLISVVDSGIGIPHDLLSKVFDRFNQADEFMVQFEGRGPGLGLALCRELMDLMQGKITLSSEVGQGTTVDIFVPYFIEERKTT